MKTLYTLPDIERSISYWSAVERAPDIVLGPNVRILADVWGKMIYEKQSAVPVTSLSPAQLYAICTALASEQPA